MRNFSTLSLICVSFVAFCGANAAEQQDRPRLVLEQMGLMYVGGRTATMGEGSNQHQIVEQAPVHYLIPPATAQKDRLPVIMVPGMGLTSYLYLGTPDRREGWATLFARHGFPVYVFDEPNNAVSGFPVGRFNAARQGRDGAGQVPGFLLWSNEVTWRRWGIGPEPGVPFDDTRYPVEQIEQLFASMTPVFGGRGGGGRGAAGLRGAAGGRGAGRRGGGSRRGPGAAGETPENRGDQPAGRPRGRRALPAAGRRPQASAPQGRGRRRPGGPGGRAPNAKAQALVQLLDKTGPAILILHSASGSTGFEATRMRPELVKAIVAVEVVGTPTDPQDIKPYFADKEYIAVFGDHFDVRPMSGRHQAANTTAKLVNEAGGTAEVIRLPEKGIRGNTHLLMQDTNNDQIANMLIDRLVD